MREEGANVATDVLAAALFAYYTWTDGAGGQTGTAAVCAAIAACRVLSAVMHGAVGARVGERQFWLAVDFVGISWASVAGGLANAHLARFSASPAAPAAYLFLLAAVASVQLVGVTLSRHPARTASFGLVNAVVHAPVIYAVAAGTYLSLIHI